MKKFSRTLQKIGIYLFFFLCTAQTIYAQGTYVPLTVGMPGDLGGFVSWAVKTTIGLGLGLAVLMIVVSGFTILLNPTNAGSLSKAKERLFDAIFGLAVIFLSWLVLSTINPGLVSFSF